jgi:hypothetical protein
VTLVIVNDSDVDKVAEFSLTGVTVPWAQRVIQTTATGNWVESVSAVLAGARFPSKSVTTVVMVPESGSPPPPPPPPAWNCTLPAFNGQLMTGEKQYTLLCGSTAPFVQGDTVTVTPSSPPASTWTCTIPAFQGQHLTGEKQYSLLCGSAAPFVQGDTVTVRPSSPPPPPPPASTWTCTLPVFQGQHTTGEKQYTLLCGSTAPFVQGDTVRVSPLSPPSASTWACTLPVFQARQTGEKQYTMLCGSTAPFLQGDTVTVTQ